MRRAETLLDGLDHFAFVRPALDRAVAANPGRRHPTLLDLGLRGALLDHPERRAADA